MGSAVRLQGDYSAGELRRLARLSKDVRQSSRLLSIAAVLDGMSRTDAARIGGMLAALLCRVPSRTIQFRKLRAPQSRFLVPMPETCPIVRSTYS